MKDKYFYIKPKKINRALEEDEVDEHRRINCIFYAHCLDHARTFRYISFSCKDCKHHCE